MCDTPDAERPPPDGPNTRRPFRLRERVGSFRYAVDGLRATLATEHNARIHAAATAAVLLAAAVLRVPAGRWGLLALAIGLVWVAELLNTAIEAAVDLVSPDRHLLAKAAKDAAAAAVLVAAVTAVIVGLCVFGPAITKLAA